MSLDEADRNDFISRANELFEDQNVGTRIGCGDVDDVKDFFNDLGNEDVGSVMDFLITEEVISFEWS